MQSIRQYTSLQRYWKLLGKARSCKLKTQLVKCEWLKCINFKVCSVTLQTNKGTLKKKGQNQMRNPGCDWLSSSNVETWLNLEKEALKLLLNRTSVCTLKWCWGFHFSLQADYLGFSRNLKHSLKKKCVILSAVKWLWWQRVLGSSPCSPHAGTCNHSHPSVEHSRWQHGWKAGQGPILIPRANLLHWPGILRELLNWLCFVFIDNNNLLNITDLCGQFNPSNAAPLNAGTDPDEVPWGQPCFARCLCKEKSC